MLSQTEPFICLYMRRLTLLAHDSSGSIGLGAAGRHADRFKALIITDSFAWPLRDYPVVSLTLRFVSGPIFGFFNQSFNLLPRLVSGVAPRRRRLSKAERTAFNQGFPTPESRGRIQQVFRSIVESEDYLREVEQGLSRLAHLPALLINGQFDPVRLFGWPTRFARAFPRHRSVIIKGEGHFPLITAQSPDTVAESRMAESLSMAFLILIESLSPVERAVLLLRDVFDYDYAEIAGILGKSEANCRQILRRARQSLMNRRTRFDTSPEQTKRRDLRRGRRSELNLHGLSKSELDHFFGGDV